MMIKLFYVVLVVAAYALPNGGTVEETAILDLSTTTSTETLTTKDVAIEENKDKENVNSTDSPHVCELYEGEGICVPYYMCSDQDEDYSLIDLHIPTLDDCYTLSYLHVCCPKDQVKPQKALEFSEAANQTNCGRHNPDGVVSNVKDGQSNFAKFGEFPWMVAVFKLEAAEVSKPEQDKLNVYVGGGSLIHPSIVLTAAHVVENHSELRIRAGEWDTQTKSELYPHQDRDVKDVVLHPDYIRSRLYNDVALLFLTEPVDASYPHIGTVCLPTSGADPETRCLASGWGKDQFGKEGRYQVFLKRNHKDRYVQNGIVSWGINCGMGGVPGVYVDVAPFRHWIDRIVARRGYNSASYTIEL